MPESLNCTICGRPINVGHTMPLRGIVHVECADARDLFYVAKLYARGKCPRVARRLLRSALVLLGRSEGNPLDAQLDHRNFAAPVLAS